MPQIWLYLQAIERFVTMFKKKSTGMAKINEPDNLHNKIGEGTVIEGEIHSEGNIRVDGTVKGSVNSKGKVVIGPAGVIDGEVICQNADVTGTIKGKITVTELLLLKATARLHGDIVTNKMGIEPGAEFTGTCAMGADLNQILNNGHAEPASVNGVEASTEEGQPVEEEGAEHAA